MEAHDDVVHYGRIIAGLESVHEHINYNAGIDTDGKYALAVLELHAQDEGEREGTEGFMDSVKRGASNIYEWIKKLIQAIRGFIANARVEKEADRMNELAKAMKDGLESSIVRRMTLPKLVQHLKAANDPWRDGNERISMDVIAEEVSKMTPEQVKQVEVYLAGIIDSPEYKEQVKEDHDFVVNKAIAALKPRLTELNSLLEQMNEADPDGNAAKELGIDPGRAFSKFGDLLNKVDHVSTSTLSSFTGDIGRGIVDATKLLKSATDRLSSLNEKNKEGGGQVVSQAARIVKLLTSFVEVGRKLIAQLTAIMEKGEYNALSVFISRRWFEARTQFAAIK